MTRDETTADYFLQASARHAVTKRTRPVRRLKFFGYEKYEVTGKGTEREDFETRALDGHIKNLPKGQVEALMTDETQGKRHATLSVRPPEDIEIPGFRPEIFPRLLPSRASSVNGGNLRFKTLEFARPQGRRSAPGVGNMKVIRFALAIAFSLAVCSAGMARPHATPRMGKQALATPSAGPVHGGLYQTPWYENALRELRPGNHNWGEWIEERRQVFLESTVANRSFDYAALVTGLLFVTWVMLGKVWIDKRRMLSLAQERFDALRRHDAYCRDIARKASEAHNEHIEKCNRVTEAETSGPLYRGQIGAGADYQAELQRTAAKLAESERERTALRAQLDRSDAVITDLSARLYKLKNNANGIAKKDQPGNDDARPRIRPW